MASGFGLVFLGVATLYLVTTFVLLLDIRDNTRETVELLREVSERDSDREDERGGPER